MYFIFFFFSSRRRHTSLTCDWSSDVCSSDLRDEHDACVDERVHGPRAQMLDHRLDAEVSHAHRVLDHDPVELTGADRGDQDRAGVEADEPDLAGQADI